MSNPCPVCNANGLVVATATEMLPYGGKEIEVHGVEFSVCAACKEEIVTPEQAKRNDLRFADAKRAADGLLVGHEIKAFRESLSLTQAEASAIYGGGVNAFSKYERGEVLQSFQMDLLLRLSKEVPVARDWLFAKAGKELGWSDLCDVIPLSTRRERCRPAMQIAHISTTLAENSDDDWQPVAATP